jgi:8-oxo-dGTP pyrophosphatase MutT (NUDIX family)
LPLLDQQLHRIRTALFTPPPRVEPPPSSAVLVPLVPDEDGLRVLFTERRLNLAHHPGEVSFPGGRMEPQDAGPLETALREAREEVGLDTTRVEILGHLVDFRTHRDFTVSAHVGLLGPGAFLGEPVRNDEVERVLLVPLASLMRTPSKPATTMGLEHDVAAYEARRYEGGAEAERTIHYWRLVDGPTVWGITGYLLAQLLERTQGWQPPAPSRTIQSRNDVLP